MEGAGRLQVAVLGPLRVRDAAGRDATPDGDLQRKLLALLVLRRGDHVAADAAIEALWPLRRRPRDPLAALQTHVFRIRRSLPSGALTSNEHGYRLDPAAVQVDADALTATVTDADPTADPAETARALADAMTAWRGGAYPELADVDDGRIESARLDELRVRAIEGRAEALLTLGQPTEVTSELAALTAAHPLRERPHELLMTALAAAGRTVEALRVYNDFRRRLGDELGIEPSPLLTARHASLLAGGGDGPVPTHRLPEPVTSMIGRDELLADTVNALGTHRLVTLLGPGGVGKTRLLIAIGHTRRQQRPARPVVLSELATATPDSAVDAVASTLGIDQRPGHATEDRLAALIADGDVVLLIDNCEHVLEPIAGLVELLLSGVPDSSSSAPRGSDCASPASTCGQSLRSPWLRTAVRPTTCSSNAPGRSVRTSHPMLPTAPPFERSSGASTGCRWPSSSPPLGCTPSTWTRSGPASIAGFASSPPVRARHHGTDR